MQNYHPNPLTIFVLNWFSYDKSVPKFRILLRMRKYQTGHTSGSIGALSGTSGKAWQTHEWTSAMLNCPLNLSSLCGLSASKTCERWWRDNGLIWYCFIMHVLGCSLGVM